MSIEVDARMFLFERNVDLPLAEMIQWSKVPNEPVLFSHNHLHDLESLWWVAVWMVLYHHFSTTPQSDDELLFDLPEAESQLALAQTFFPPMSHPTRQNSFQQSLKKTCT